MKTYVLHFTFSCRLGPGHAADVVRTFSGVTSYQQTAEGDFVLHHGIDGHTTRVRPTYLYVDITEKEVFE